MPCQRLERRLQRLAAALPLRRHLHWRRQWRVRGVSRQLLLQCLPHAPVLSAQQLARGLGQRGRLRVPGGLLLAQRDEPVLQVPSQHVLPRRADRQPLRLQLDEPDRVRDHRAVPVRPGHVARVRRRAQRGRRLRATRTATATATAGLERGLLLLRRGRHLRQQHAAAVPGAQLLAAGERQLQ